MHDFKGFFCLALAFCLIFALAVPCFADPVTLSGAEFFMSLWGSYASQHGLGMIFSENGVQSSSQNPFSVQSYREAGSQLIEDFLDYSNSIYSDADEFYDAYKEEVTVTQNVNNQVIMHWSNTLTEWFDQFANWLLGDEYGLTATDSGFAHSSGSFDSPLSVLPGNFASVPVSSNPAADGVYVGVAVGGYGDLFVSSSSSDVFVACALSGSTYLTCALSLSSFADTYFYYSSTHGSGTVTGVQYQSQVVNGVTVYYTTYLPARISSPSIPAFNSFSALIDAFVQGVDVGSTIDLRPKDKYNEDPTANPIPVPDTSDAGYLPAPQDYVLNPSYVFSLPADVTALINSLTDALVENVDPLAVEGEEPAPPSMTPVELPFLGFTLPSFNLGLSSIWQYVIDWVGSLGSGLSFIGSVWSNIPYAMVIPIYASAVVVIVLGMFKRFLL